MQWGNEIGESWKKQEVKEVIKPVEVRIVEEVKPEEKKVEEKKV